jgi:hypothetical protein
MEVGDVLVREIRDLVARGTVERLQPEVINAIGVNRIDQRFSIGRKGRPVLHTRVRRKKSELWSGACVERKEADAPDGWIISGPAGGNYIGVLLPARRETDDQITDDATRNHGARNDFGLARSQ